MKKSYKETFALTELPFSNCRQKKRTKKWWTAAEQPGSKDFGTVIT